MSKHEEIDLRPYEVFWEGDPRRQAAQRGANARFPDHSTGKLSQRDPALFWGVIVAAGATVVFGALVAAVFMGAL